MTTEIKKSKGWNIGLWIAQVLMAGLFGLVGITKLTTPISELAEMLPWITESPEMVVRFIGLSELLGAVGLILPTALRMQPQLTNFAAIGLAIVMVLATGFHVYRGEFEVVPVNIILLGILILINWGRNKKAPVLPKGEFSTVHF